MHIQRGFHFLRTSRKRQGVLNCVKVPFRPSSCHIFFGVEASHCPVYPSCPVRLSVVWSCLSYSTHAPGLLLQNCAPALPSLLALPSSINLCFSFCSCHPQKTNKATPRAAYHAEDHLCHIHQQHLCPNNDCPCQQPRNSTDKDASKSQLFNCHLSLISFFPLLNCALNTVETIISR